LPVGSGAGRAGLPGRRWTDERGVDDDVGSVAVGFAVEFASAGDELQGAVAARAVYLAGRELRFGIGRHGLDGEPDDSAVRPGDRDLVTRAQGVQPVEDGRTPVGVDVSEDDGGS